MISLGVCFDIGNGVIHDMTKAIESFTKAADGNDVVKDDSLARHGGLLLTKPTLQH